MWARTNSSTILCDFTNTHDEKNRCKRVWKQSTLHYRYITYSRVQNIETLYYIRAHGEDKRDSKECIDIIELRFFGAYDT